MAQERPQPLQDTFLRHLREHKVPVTVFLANGIRLQGTVTAFDSYSLLRLIEDNWGLGRIGGTSFDRIAGSLADAFAFQAPRNHRLFLDPITGEPTGQSDGD